MKKYIIILCAALPAAAAYGCGCGATKEGGDTGTDTTDTLDPFDWLDGEAPDLPVDGTDTVEEELTCPSAIVCGTPPVCCDVAEECIEGRCLPVCPSGVRCSDDLSTCCDSGQVCINDACATPGAPCIDSYDCGLDMFCEPTLELCLPQFDPVECEIPVAPASFDVVQEWAWTGSDILPQYDNVISAPVIIDLDGDRIPEVVFNANIRGSWIDGTLRAIRGDSGEDYWTVTDENYRLIGRSSIAAADIDNDGSVEIIAFSRGSPIDAMNSRVLCFNWDGSIRWQGHLADGTVVEYVVNNAGPTIADLDGDGNSEIIVGAVILDHEGLVLHDSGATEGTNRTYTGGLPAVADIDVDTIPDIATGARAWELNGDLKWDSTADHGTLDGYPAVADFDLDTVPEIVVVGSGYVQIINGENGSPYWTAVAIPGGGIGGPPTVSDFDGDTLPEIGVAGADSYSIYDPDGDDPVLWSHATQDHSSNTTGSSVFDFEGDGIAEVVYCDECFMRVYAGLTGEILLEIQNSSLTIHEYPLVADVDGDGNSEIVLVANDTGYDGRCDWAGSYVARHGVFAYGDASDRWVPTRRIWNQHTYHVTNVNADGSVPAVELNNWESDELNNYRQNVQGAGIFNAPDLTIIALSVDLSGCPGTVTLQARVSNIGSLGVPSGTIVAFYEGTLDAIGRLLGTAVVTVDLLPGASTLVTLTTPLEGSPPFAFVAIVDDDGTGTGVVEECNEDNNAAAIDGIDCDIVI